MVDEFDARGAVVVEELNSVPGFRASKRLATVGVTSGADTVKVEADGTQQLARLHAGPES